jgi:leader peptidase (prepilin peptidase)/N-methyltransferase
MTGWLLACGAVAVAAGTTLGAVLRALPEPAGAQGKTPYATLATPGTRIAVGLSVFTALVVSVLAVPWPGFLPLVPLGTLGVLSAVVDARTTYLPRRLTWIGTASMAGFALVAAILARDPWVIAGAVAGSLGMGALFWLLWRFSGGFGFGDVRLAFLVGGSVGCLGASAVLSSALLGSLIGVIWGVAARVSDRRARRPAGPFAYGPSLVVGPYLWLTWTMMVAGPWPVMRA